MSDANDHTQSPPFGDITETPLQRDRAKTIYERSVSGRRAAVFAEAGVPEAETPLEDLIPSNLLREEPATVSYTHLTLPTNREV